MNQKHVRQCLTEALAEVYEIFRIQSNHDLSPKQKKFIDIAARKICGKEIKEKTSPTSRPDKEDSPFYECDVCQKKCSSTSGLTLHKKLTHGNAI